MEGDFHHLTPDVVIGLVEETLGEYCTNICRPMNSYINRVYELQMESGQHVVVKFYRPGRWSIEALQEEHEFYADLHAHDIPVIAPMRIEDKGTLHESNGMHYTIFEKKGGRNCDEFTMDQWVELGSLMGRLHAVGAERDAQRRVTMTPEKLTRDQLTFIKEGDFIPSDLLNQYSDTTDQLMETIEPLFNSTPLQRIHGDCHFNNIIYRPGESFYIIDFDDMAMGPAIQDLWMLLPGRAKDSLVELDLFIEGYEVFCEFSRIQIRLIEALRSMRYIHYCAWCAHQVSDGGFQRLAPGWGEPSYWKGEMRDILQQIGEIQEAQEGNAMGNC